MMMMMMMMMLMMVMVMMMVMCNDQTVQLFGLNGLHLQLLLQRERPQEAGPPPGPTRDAGVQASDCPLSAWWPPGAPRPLH